jgi:DNA-binding winged helix-turn-helix (wHTH) protein/Tfp pilus assembly protein PilF
MKQLSPTPSGRRQYQFGPYRLDLEERRLWRDGDAVALTSRVFDILAVLVANSGRPMDKDEVMRQVWPDSIVEEGNLTRNVSTLRRVLGDSPEDHQYIITLPGRGYQFVQPVQEILDAEFGEAMAASRTRAQTLAVLPFHWLNSEPADEHVGIGLADTLITRLGNLKQVVVRPTSSVLKYQSVQQDLQETGRKLRVELVLEGSLRRVDDSIRATVRLTNVQDGSTVWADKFDEAWTDLLKVEDSIAERMVAALALRLTGEEKQALERQGTSSLEAYKLFAKARFLWNKRTLADLDLAIRYFEQAIARDPNYALAHVGLADTYVLLASMGGIPPTEAYPKAYAAVARSLQLNNRLGEAHVTLGHIKVQYDWDRPRAEIEYWRALELNPNYSPAHLYYAIFLKNSKREREAMVEIDQALELDPVSPALNASKGNFLYDFRHTSQAVQQLRHAIELEPHFWYSHFWLALAYAHEKRGEEALEEARKATDLSSGTNPWLLGYVQGVCGQRLEAEKSLQNLLTISRQRYVPPYDIALVHVGLGRKQQALDWLERGYQERSRWMDTLSVSPHFDPLRSEPRFQSLLHRLGLPQ